MASGNSHRKMADVSTGVSFGILLIVMSICEPFIEAIGSVSDTNSSLCANFTIRDNMNVEYITVNGTEYVNITCDPYYILYGGSGQTELPMLVQCNNNETANTWSLTEECILIDCGELEAGKYIKITGDWGTTAGQTKSFVCDSGYQHYMSRWGYTTCTVNGTWDIAPGGGSPSCGKTNKAFGCFEKNSVNETSHAVFTESECLRTCTQEDKRFAALSTEGCSCSNAIENENEIQNELCNYSCSVTKQSDNAYCGGPNGEQAVYLTTQRAACYRDLDTFNISMSTFAVTVGDLKNTCIQLCLGMGAYFAIYYKGTGSCSCSKENIINAVSVDELFCEGETGSGQETYGMIKNLATGVGKRDSCKNLYKNDKIRKHGTYMLSSGDIVDCQFFDGTPCDDGWIGYGGICYNFQYQNISNFNGNQGRCLEMNSNLLSILSAAEKDFVDTTLTSFDEYSTVSRWMIGLTDPQGVSSFLWTDGNLQQYSSWRTVSPQNEYEQCAVTSLNGLWNEVSCQSHYAFICKKTPDHFSCIKTNSSLSGGDVTDSFDISLTSCAQICMGKRFVYSAVRGTECQCLNSLPASQQNISLLECNTNCSGNVFQKCGGSDDYVYTVLKVDSYSKPESCEDLQAAGISGINTVLQQTSTPIYCNTSVCPYSWIQGNSSCYKFSKAMRDVTDSVKYCSKYNSYLAIPSTIEEDNFIQETVSGVSYFRAATRWRLGMKATRLASKVYRTASGEQLPTFFNVSDDFLYTYLTLNSSWGTTSDSSKRMSFICEKNEAYAGCYVLDSGTTSVIESDAIFMSVTQCVESCRGQAHAYALLTPSDCYCASSLPKNESSDCTSVCVDNHIQACGKASASSSDVIVSVYNVDAYQVLSSCQELYDAGIRRHGLYSVTDGLIYCNFLDNSTACSQGWISFKNECYKIGELSNNRDGAQSLCKAYGGRVGTIQDKDSHDFIKDLILGSEKTAVDNVRLGLNDWRYLSTFTWLSGKLTHYLPLLTSGVSQKNERMLKSTSNYDVYEESDQNGVCEGVLCEIGNDYLGCFTKFPLLTSLILGSGTMDLTQCRQICLGSKYKYAMAQQTDCFCGNETELAQLNPVNDSLCTWSCSSSEGQRCGYENYVTVYELDESEAADSCEQLYQYGVMHNGSYLINDNGTLDTKQCGFTDTTYCTLGWQGFKRTCYFIWNASHTTNNNTEAFEYCIQRGGYLFSPYNIEQIPFLQNILSAYQSLSSYEYYYTGIYNRFQNGMYLSGSGHFVKIENLNSSANGTSWTFVSFSKTSGQLTEAQDLGSFAVCEKSSDYFGLFEYLTNETKEFSVTRYPITATTCIQLCLGQNSSLYATVSGSKCGCPDNFNLRAGTDEGYEVCPGYSSQPCGKTSKKSFPVFNLENYDRDIVESCDQLYNYGVAMKGVYRIEPENMVEQIYVQCFAKDESIAPLYNTEAGHTVKASSSFDQYTATKRILTPFVDSDYNAWIPMTNSSLEYLEFTSPVDYIITGIVTQGLQSSTKDFWVTSYSIEYEDDTGSMVPFHSQFGNTIAGNTDMTNTVTRYFADPLLASKIRVYPQTWNNVPALRIGTFGMKFEKFNHSETYLGCYANLRTFYIASGVLSNAACKEKCRSKMAPFYSFYGPISTCQCGDDVGKYGRYDDSLCFPTVQHSKNALPVYRTYEKFCEPYNIVNATLVSTFQHVQDIYTWKSLMTFTCADGYRFSDSSKNKTVKCRINNTWTEEPDECRPLNCSNLTAPQNGNLDSTKVVFGSVVTISCVTGHVFPDGRNTRVLECIEPGIWNATVDDCSVIDCGTPPYSLSTTQAGSSYVYNKTVTYTCDPHTATEANDTQFDLLCTDAGTWYPEPQNCSLYECPDPPALSYGTVQRINSTHAQYQCNTYYELSSKQSHHFLECDDNFIWQNLDVTCQSIEILMSQKRGTFSLVGKYARANPSSEITHHNVCSSFMDCADSCMRKIQCVAYSFNPKYNLCKLFSTKASNTELSPHTDTKYFEVANVEYTFF